MIFRFAQIRGLIDIFKSMAWPMLLDLLHWFPVMSLQFPEFLGGVAYNILFLLVGLNRKMTPNCTNVCNEFHGEAAVIDAVILKTQDHILLSSLVVSS